MISSARVKTVRDRLIAAIRRHGLLTVSLLLLDAMLRHGIVATLRFVPSRYRPALRPRNRPSAGVREARPPPDLDEAYTLDARAWARWSGIVGAGAPATGRRDQTPRLLFVVRGIEQAPGDMQRTNAAIMGMGPTSALWRAGAPDEAVDFVVFLAPGDVPSPDMPQSLAQSAVGGRVDVITFDMVRVQGDRMQPLLLPGANPTLLETVDYVFSRVAVAPSVLADASNLEGMDPRAVLLRWMRGRPAHEVRGRWRHVGRPLVEAAIDSEAITAARREAMARNRLPARSYTGEPITVVICTHNKGHLTRQLLHHLIAEDAALVGEVVVVSNNTTNAYALETLEDIARSSRVRVLRQDEPFNFSKLSNAGARHSQGRGPLLFLNDDIVPVSEHWLQRLAVRLEDPAVGSAGSLLLYPDERVQHAGIYLGHKSGAGHVLRAARLPEEDYLFTACAPREVSALTGASLLTPRAVFEGLNGFDEQLALAFQDVDYCLRLKACGLINVFEPASVLFHMESASIKSLGLTGAVQRRRRAERMRFEHRWDGSLYADPLHPCGFDLEDESLRRLAGPFGKRPKSFAGTNRLAKWALGGRAQPG